MGSPAIYQETVVQQVKYLLFITTSFDATMLRPTTIYKMSTGLCLSDGLGPRIGDHRPMHVTESPLAELLIEIIRNNVDI